VEQVYNNTALFGWVATIAPSANRIHPEQIPAI